MGKPTKLNLWVQSREEKIVVTVRLMPLNKREQLTKDQVSWECIDDHTIVYKPPPHERVTQPASFTFGWVQKRLMKLYIDCCNELCEPPNMKLLKRLYVSEVEDEVIVYDCELQDISITPLLNALHANKTVAMLDLSHNLLGNGTMEKLQQFFTTSSQKYGDMTLDLHCNRFGPTALFQICECSVLFTRLEVLNLSGNRLTDACGSYLSTILENCKENDTLEELNHADNADLDKQLALQHDTTANMSSELLSPNVNTSECSLKGGISKEADTDEHDLCPMNTDCKQLEVAGSEDDEIRVEAAASGFDNSCTSLCQKNSSFECQFIQELSTAVGRAKHLQLLDLSNNGFSTQGAKTLYSSWSSRSGVSQARKHIEEHTIIHFSVEENKCYKVFGPACLTETVYDGVKNVALSALNGINGIAYLLFTPHRDFTIKISGLEIYNENVKDLLNSDSGRNLKLLDDPEKGTVVEKLVEETANAQRQVGETTLNDTSSRSHQIIRLVLDIEANEAAGFNLEDDEIAIETEEPQVSWTITFRAEATDN
ncbi:hypothetical protein EZV62_028130 [Acer yangbiense]|uniref:Kinesin motor domain-containing protein n=1 Tax=Acer yangbiense TaxID=1000413 RepID=A0A5C7GP73_9ROSI|nr:hypothetical protein EZV62_028130 [Acer yangbiense]